MEQFKWNYVLEEEEEDDKDDKDKDNDDDMEEDIDNDSDVDDKQNASSPTTSNEKCKYNAITPPGDDDMAEYSIAKSYPHLSRALGGEDGCFDPMNPSVQKLMHCLLSELNNLLSSTYQLDVSGLSHNTLSYIQVPWTKSNCSFLNSKKWVDTTIQIFGSKHGGTFKSAYCIANHVICYYNDSFLATCKTQ
jgi:hypothetical protein